MGLVGLAVNHLIQGCRVAWGSAGMCERLARMQGWPGLSQQHVWESEHTRH